MRRDSKWKMAGEECYQKDNINSDIQILRIDRTDKLTMDLNR